MVREDCRPEPTAGAVSVGWISREIGAAAFLGKLSVKGEPVSEDRIVVTARRSENDGPVSGPISPLPRAPLRGIPGSG